MDAGEGDAGEGDSMYTYETDEQETFDGELSGQGNLGDCGDGDTSGVEPGLGIDDPELEAIKARVREMEEEAEKIKAMHSEVEKQMNMSTPSIGSPAAAMSLEEKMDADARSIWVGNVDYGATAEELEAHFHGCGSVNRVTIHCDKFTGHPKGFAYIEFADKDAINTAMALDDSLFRGRQIKVTTKRTNRPGMSSTNRPPRGGRGGHRPRGGAYHPGGYQGYAPRGSFRPRYRPRRASYYSPY